MATTTTPPVTPHLSSPSSMNARITAVLLNIAHAIDHMFLLIFAAAVSTIALEFGFASWEDLMPYGVGAFFMFGLGSLPSGRLGDLWGRRRMMLVFFFGMGVSCMLAALTQNAWQLAIVMTLIGTFASIYHPVGIPMLVQNAAKPGATIGLNGLAGNLGVAVAALVTGFLVKWFGWRTAFFVPGLVSIALGFLFLKVCPQESEAPAKRKSKAAVVLPPRMLARALAVLTATSAVSSLLFNLTTNGNGQLLTERFRGVIEDPAMLGALLAVVYAIASIAQVVVGRLIDRIAFKPLYLSILLLQIPLLALAAYAQGWWLFVALLGTMIAVFGAIPFIDVMVVRYVDDRIRSRVSGARLTISIGFGSLVVWLLGPLVKDMGFTNLLLLSSLISLTAAAMVTLLPSDRVAAQSPAP